MSRLALAVVALAVAVPVTAAEKPNIVVIVGDDMGYADVGFHGCKDIPTPNLDALAKAGTRFTSGYVSGPYCSPTRAGLLTGRYQTRFGHEFNGNGPEVGLPLSETTIADRLKTAGYATAWVGKWHLGGADKFHPQKRGFDTAFGFLGGAHPYFPGKGEPILRGTKDANETEYLTDAFGREAVSFVDKNKAKPFFLYLPFTVPHVAVQVPEDALDEYKGKLGDDPAYDGKKGYRPHPAPHAGYAAMVTRMDRSVGRIVEKLKALGLEKDTLILFTSDNGPTHNVGGADSTFFNSAGKLRGLKGSLYEGGVRVPLIAYMPGTIKAGGTTDARFYFPDVLPTLSEFAGAKVPDKLDGISFRPVLTGAKQRAHEFLYWEFPGYGGQQAVIAGDWKAVRQALGKGVVKTELYNLATDEGEKDDVAAKHPDVLARLEKLLKDQHTPSADFPLQAIDPPVKK